MVILGNWDGQELTLSIKSNCLTVSLQSGGQVQVWSFDYEGRLWTAMQAGISYRRGLDGKVIAKWIDERGQRQRRQLSCSEGSDLEEQARQVAGRLHHALALGQVKTSSPIDDLGRLGLFAAAQYDPDRRILDIEHYYQVYKPVGILPPDQYMAVLLQASEGCSFNSCTFCNFYKDRPFRIKTLAEFSQHCLDVKAFLGKGLALRRTIFLGDANALVIPMARLVPMLDAVQTHYNVESLGGIYAFLDGFSAEKKSTADYRLLAQKGVRRVYIGMESGSNELLHFLHKPGRVEDVIDSVRAMKAGGVAVGLIVLLGAGGQQYAQGHVPDTIQAINAIPLDADDLIYFSELVTNDQLTYTQDAYRQNLHPLTAEQRLNQQEEIEAGLIFDPQSGTPHISRYDIREFIY